MTKHLTWPAYLIGTLLVFVSLLDGAASVWPLLFSDVGWRYGSYGLLSGYLLTPLLGAFLITLTAALQGSRRTQRVIGVINMVAAVLLLIAFVAFLLDVFQVRAGVQEDSRGVFDFGVFKAALKHVLTLIVLGMMGLGSFRGAPPAARSRSGGPAADSPLVMMRSQGDGGQSSESRS